MSEAKKSPKIAKKREVDKQKLSFVFEEDNNESSSIVINEYNHEVQNDRSSNLKSHQNLVNQPISKKIKLSKDPNAQTSFLPDKMRDVFELRERAELAQKWKQEQELIKSISF